MNFIMYGNDMESLRQLSNDERLGAWAAEFYGAGHHHEQGHVVEQDKDQSHDEGE